MFEVKKKLTLCLNYNLRESRNKIVRKLYEETEVLHIQPLILFKYLLKSFLYDFLQFLHLKAE